MDSYSVRKGDSSYYRQLIRVIKDVQNLEDNYLYFLLLYGACNTA